MSPLHRGVGKGLFLPAELPGLPTNADPLPPVPSRLRAEPLTSPGLNVPAEEEEDGADDDDEEGPVPPPGPGSC